LSETTQESNDSIAPSKAIVIAGFIKVVIVCKSICGICGFGIDDDISLNLEPIVSVGRLLYQK